MDHLIINTIHFDGVSLFDLLDKLVVLTKDNVCLVKASIEVAKDIIFSNLLSISVHVNVHTAFNECSFDSNCLESFFDLQSSFGSSFIIESDLDGVRGVHHLFLADLLLGGLSLFGQEKGFHQVNIRFLGRDASKSVVCQANHVPSDGSNDYGDKDMLNVLHEHPHRGMFGLAWVRDHFGLNQVADLMRWVQVE